MPSGFIKLYRKDGLLLADHWYASVADRKKILQSWRKKSPKTFKEGAYIHLRPTHNSYKVRVDGTNKGGPPSERLLNGRLRMTYNSQIDPL